jgi:hypothetical protein
MIEIEVSVYEVNLAEDIPAAEQKVEISAAENQPKYDHHIHYLRLLSWFPGAKRVIE